MTYLDLSLSSTCQKGEQGQLTEGACLGGRVADDIYSAASATAAPRCVAVRELACAHRVGAPCTDTGDAGGRDRSLKAAKSRRFALSLRRMRRAASPCAGRHAGLAWPRPGHWAAAWREKRRSLSGFNGERWKWADAPGAFAAWDRGSAIGYASGRACGTVRANDPSAQLATGRERPWQAEAPGPKRIAPGLAQDKCSNAHSQRGLVGRSALGGVGCGPATTA